MQDEANYIIVASNQGKDRDPAWLFNLRSNKHASIQLKDIKKEVTSKVADTKERNRLWPKIIELSPAYENYQKNYLSSNSIGDFKPRGLGSSAARGVDAGMWLLHP